MPSFYNGKRFFLTYPQCDSLPIELVAFLQQQGPIKSYLVSREKHEDGNYHLHACVEFTTKQSKQVNWLDFNSKHPNKQDPRNWAACKTYCKKDGDYVEGPEDNLDERDIVEICKDYHLEEDWFSYCLSKRMPFQYATWFWTRCHQDDTTLSTNECEGTLCPQLQEFKWNESMKCLILRGNSGCGKTTWAKRSLPTPILFVSHIDTLKKFRPGFHKSILFDDIDVKHYPRTSQIHLVDFENSRDIHCRHTVAHIPAGIYKVFTCNEWPLTEDPAIARRCVRRTVAK